MPAFSATPAAGHDEDVEVVQRRVRGWRHAIRRAYLWRQTEPGLRVRGFTVGILVGGIVGGVVGAIAIATAAGLNFGTAVFFSVIAGAVCTALAGVLLGVHKQRPMVRESDVFAARLQPRDDGQGGVRT